MATDILQILKHQHKNILSLLDSIKMLKPGAEAEGILRQLKALKMLLIHHVDLEDSVFYPELLIKMEKSGTASEETRKFIGEMKKIASDFMLFSDENDSLEKISTNLGFAKSLADVSQQLRSRVNREEESVYAYWNNF